MTVRKQKAAREEIHFPWKEKELVRAGGLDPGGRVPMSFL